MQKNYIHKKLDSLIKQKESILNKISKTKNYLRTLYEDKVSDLITAEQFKKLITDYNSDDEN